MTNISKITVSIIVARSLNHVIGSDGDLPFHLRTDLQNFKRLTTGKPIIMGRKTLGTFPKLLPNRTHIVISRDYEFYHDGILLYSNIENAIDAAKAIALRQGVSEVFIIGGGQIYAQSQKYVDKIYLTEVDCQTNGDTYFEIDNEDDWEITTTDNFNAGEHDDFSFRVVEMHRKNSKNA